jgi:dihydropteroate synthase
MSIIKDFTIGRLAPDFHGGDTLLCGRLALSLQQPAVMGILNITPDSFSDGGELCDAGGVRLDAVLQRAEAMIAAGADILDVGGESTRPGAIKPGSQQEMDRVAPVIEALSRRFAVPVSIDTSNPQLISEAAALGAGMINDVRALQRSGALQAAVSSGLPVCLMHMQGQPDSMQAKPRYANVVQEVLEFLQQRLDECIAAGIPRDQLLIDPGFGFGKTVAHNLLLSKHLATFVDTGYPVLVGMSRKSMIGAVTGREVGDRLAGGLALAALAVLSGVAIMRVHDVAQTRDVVETIMAVIREPEA